MWSGECASLVFGDVFLLITVVQVASSVHVSTGSCLDTKSSQLLHVDGYTWLCGCPYPSILVMVGWVAPLASIADI